MYKAPDGKLLKASFKIEDDVLTYIKITGDFFMHPEEKIEELEQMLTGKKASRETVLTLTVEFMKSDVQVIGAKAEDFAELFFPLKSE